MIQKSITNHLKCVLIDISIELNDPLEYLSLIEFLFMNINSALTFLHRRFLFEIELMNV